MVFDITTRNARLADHPHETPEDRPGRSPEPGDAWPEVPDSPAAVRAPDAQSEPVVPVAAPEDPTERSGPFSRGQRVGEAYEITRMLGAGGMGMVYEAHDVLLDRHVAIKVPLLPQYAQTLRREAQAMAAVHHPNLVRIFAVGHEGSVEFIVMERVFGMTLEDRVAEAWNAERPIPLEEALDLLMAITDGLTAVHRVGAAHRDLKSANVMISGERVVLTDFGLMMPEIAIHAGGPVAGSADYMAPELILGMVRPGQGPLVDLYALGVVAFEVLARRRPYIFDTSHAVLLAHVGQPPPDVRSFRNDAPDDLAAIIHELLAKGPEERPDSAESVLWRLGAIRADLPPPSGTAHLSVLIVDDDPDVGAMLRRNLQWSLPRLAAEACTDAHEALARMKRKMPDIVVVDLNMPGMNGVELCMNLSGFPERTRPVIVAMSGEASHRDEVVLRSLGVRELVAKDARFVPHLCDVIGDVRRRRHGPPPHHGQSRPPR